WELNQEKEELEKYIKDGLDKKHQIPMIVELDDTPVGYFEFYWVKEDRLGPYYDARPYDRGFHFLIGNKRFLGKANTDAITHSALHFIYLDDQRTDYVMAEPRYDNNKVLKYADETIGWDALKVFDFPHKRAVLLQNTRTRFFKGARL
ncbi:MAG: GNAT family N-acetyltransferase, partial [Bacteriovoracaceae bacterium]